MENQNLDITSMSDEEYKNYLLKDVLNKLEKRKNGVLDTDKWSDPNYLKNLSADEINENWDKVQEGLRKIR